MATESIETLVEGGKATAAPPLGPALGPLGVNIGQVISEINKKTGEFKGMQVPVKIAVNKETKEFSVTVGTPPVSALVKKEAGIEKGSGNPLQDKVADIKIEQAIKISKMKVDSLLGRTPVARVKEVIGTCGSMGVLVEGNDYKTVLREIEGGKFVEKINAGKTELSQEELKHLEEEKKKLQEEMTKRKTEFESKAKAIIEKLTGKPRSEIKAALNEAKIPAAMIEELLPAAGPTTPDAKGGKGAAPAKGAPAKK